MTKRCEGCKFLYKQDTGYSNWTVLEIELHCLKKLNPGMPKDEEYRPEGGDPVMAFAENCPGYTEGVGLDIDCDQDRMPYESTASLASFYTDDADVIAAFDAYHV